MGRDCGEVRPPLDRLSAAAMDALKVEIAAIPLMSKEPKGW
jgi:hypothetical protein